MYDDDWEDDGWGDEFFFCGCKTPGCVMPGEHYASECHTAREAAMYHGDKLPLSLREPFYTLGILWRRMRYRDSDVHRQEWHFHWTCEVRPWLESFLPKRRDRYEESSELPF